MEERYTFSDFVATLQDNFSQFINSGNGMGADGEYTQSVFDNFLRSIIGQKDDDDVEIAEENPNKPVGNMNVQIYGSSDVVCSIFNHRLTKADFIIINTTLNIVMLMISIIILKKSKG